jgi:hypothetical protein
VIIITVPLHYKSTAFCPHSISYGRIILHVKLNKEGNVHMNTYLRHGHATIVAKEKHICSMYSIPGSKAAVARG